MPKMTAWTWTIDAHLHLGQNMMRLVMVARTLILMRITNLWSVYRSITQMAIMMMILWFPMIDHCLRCPMHAG